MENKIYVNTSIELLNEDAYASISLNPLFQWAKIVVTDDQPNGIKQRIPLEEFDNLMKTGIFTPLKMEFGKIADHQEAKGKPIGVFSSFVKEANRVIGLAALWKKEREEDISMLKDMYLNNLPPQVSWELSYTESEFKDDVEDLKGVIFNGAVVVANPAYKGRTPIIAMASEGGDVEKLQELENRVAELERSKGDLEKSKAELETELASLKTTLSEKETLLTTKDAELEELRAFKTETEKAKAELEKMASIKTKFQEAGIEKEEAYFEENKEKLLGMEDSLLDFVIQELVAFSSTDNRSSSASTKIPKITNTSDNIDLDDPKALGKYLRESKVK